MTRTNHNIVKYVVPTMLSNLSIFLFSIVDGIFVGRGVGMDALGAVNMVMPFIMVMSTLFMLTTIGGVTICAVAVGRKDPEEANQAFLHALLLETILGAIISLIAVVWTEEVCNLMGANDTFRGLMEEYLFWYGLFILPSGWMTVLSAFVRNDGGPIFASAATIVSTFMNIFLDWLFVFPLGWGLSGAAFATGLSEMACFLIVSIPIVRKYGQLRLKRFRPEAEMFVRILKNGLPEALNQITAPVSTIVMNLVLLRYVGDIGVNSFSLMMYIVTFTAAVFIGAGEGLQPLFGQSYGRRNARALTSYLYAGLKISGGGSLLIFILLLFSGEIVCGWFGPDAVTLSYTVERMPRMTIGFVLMAVNVMMASYLYSTERVRSAMWINALRGILVNTAVILILPVLFGKEAIWYSLLVYEGAVLPVAIVLLYRARRREREILRNEDSETAGTAGEAV